MVDTKWVLIVGAEAAALLLFGCVFLLVRVRGLNQVVSAMEARILALRDKLKGVRREAGTARQELAQLRENKPKDYGEFVDEHIAATRNHHLSLNSDRDIVLDISPGTPLARQAVSLRHAFLIAEKESWLATEGKDTDWDVLESKLGQIIQFYETPAEPVDLAPAVPDAQFDADTELLRETVETQKRHIENLERFKKLYFDTEQKFREASANAKSYQDQLLAHGRELGAGSDFESLLNNYATTYNDFGKNMAEQGRSVGGGGPLEVGADGAAPSVGRIVIANQEEIQRLRNMAVDQHKMILQLRTQLSSAQSLEEKDAAIEELHKQLERHERFLKESDICSKQLETELERLLDENQGLKRKITDTRIEDAGASSEKETAQLHALVRDFTQQSCEMLSTIEQLELENTRLRAELKDVDGSDPTAMTELKGRLTVAQQDLLNLQAQHIELEERYLELKIQTG